MTKPDLSSVERGEGLKRRPSPHTPLLAQTTKSLTDADPIDDIYKPASLRSDGDAIPGILIAISPGIVIGFAGIRTASGVTFHQCQSRISYAEGPETVDSGGGLV